MEVSSADSLGSQSQLVASFQREISVQLTQLRIKLHKTVEESRAQSYQRKAVVQAIRRP